MKDIDFLPQRYRDRAVRVRARAWRLGMVSSLLAFAILVAVAQFTVRRSVQHELSLVTSRYPAALAATAQCETLRQEIRDGDAYAALYTYLRHPWPVSRLVDDVTRSLPEAISIRSLRLETTQALATVPTNAAPEAPSTTLHPAELDLAKLRSERDPLRISLHLAGSASDSQSLHQFVRGLAPSRYFATAKLESVESTTTATGSVETHFELRLEVRPGFGQPGGPTTPMVEEPPPTVAVDDPSSDTLRLLP